MVDQMFWSAHRNAKYRKLSSYSTLAWVLCWLGEPSRLTTKSPTSGAATQGASSSLASTLMLDDLRRTLQGDFRGACHDPATEIQNRIATPKTLRLEFMNPPFGIFFFFDRF